MKMKRMDTINVIPFIDIMLVLLVMVLTTATFIKTNVLSVSIPKGEGVAAEDKPVELKLVIKQDGSLWIDDKTEVSLEEFEKKVILGGKDMPITLYSDKKAEFQNFVDVMSTLKRLDHEDIYVVTDKQ